MRPWAPAILVLAGCATGGPVAQLPVGQPGPAQEIPVDAAAGQEADFRVAAQKVSAGEPEAAQAALKRCLAAHPAHALRTAAVALLGRLALDRGDAAGAKTLIEKQPEAGKDPSLAFVLGLAESRLGNGTRALALLTPFSSSGPPPMGGTVDRVTELMLRVALAEALAATGNLGGALAEWDTYRNASDAREHERA